MLQWRILTKKAPCRVGKVNISNGVDPWLMANVDTCWPLTLHRVLLPNNSQLQSYYEKVIKLILHLKIG